MMGFLKSQSYVSVKKLTSDLDEKNLLTDDRVEVVNVAELAWISDTLIFEASSRTKKHNG